MSGTLLSDLDSAGSVSGGSSSDDNAVQRILSEMNSGGAPPAPQVQSRQPPAQAMNAPNPNSTIQHSMDGVPPTAHIIGMEHPTNGDFAQMMYGRPAGNSQQYMQQNPYAQPTMQAPMYMPSMYKKNWYSDLAIEMKTPILVSLIFFVLSLPFVSVLMSHYFPSLVKGSGDLTSFGLLVKSGFAGASFWVLHRIVAPLLISS